MITTDMKEAASALGAKTARACDSCLRRRARWFCAADDAFLCQACDNLVHSANPLARRHERVQLQSVVPSSNNNKVTSWHSGFTRKARTPRHNNKHHSVLQQRLKHEVLFNNATSILPVVPEVGGSEEEPVLEDDQTEEGLLLCRVPVFDPFEAEAEAELCNMYNDVNNNHAAHEEEAARDLLYNFSEFLPSDMDLAEFAADVETLLESGVDEDSGEMKVFDCKEEDETNAYVEGRGDKSALMVKVKDEELIDADADADCNLVESVLDMTCDAFDWNIDSVLSPPPPDTHEETEEKAMVAVAESNSNSTSVNNKVEGTKRDIFLRLNYEDVITAWASQGSPWTTGNPPQFNFDADCWLNCLDWSGADVQCSSYGGVRSLRGHLGGRSGDGGREARVSRYREKRRTRLFAKKIRYEVRKLNAEKRPRMKGRFVKRTCFVGGATAFPNFY